MKGEILQVSKIQDNLSMENYYEVSIKCKEWPTFLENEFVEIKQGGNDNDDGRRKQSKVENPLTSVG